MELVPEYWDEDGRPKFYTEDKGAFDTSVFGGRYIVKKSLIPDIEKVDSELIAILVK